MKFIKSGLLVSLLSLVFISCGKNHNIVKGIDVQERIEEDKVFLDVEATLDLGNTVIMPTRFPVKLPNKGEIGEVEIGVDFIKVTVALSELMKLPLQNALLPNGGRLPLISTNRVITIPLDKNGKSLLYISLVGKAKAIGITLAIKELAKLGAKQGRIDAFPAVKLGEFRVFAGFYASPVAEENGIGIFADLNPLFDMLSAQGRWFEQPTEQPIELDYTPVSVSNKKQKAVNNYMYDLHKKSAELNIVE